MQLLQQFLRHLSEMTFLDTTITAEIIFLESFLNNAEDWDRVIDPLARRQRLIDDFRRSKKFKGFFLYTIHSDWVISSVFAISRGHNIRFEDLASFLIGKLGKEKAKQLVKKEDVVRFYDKECLEAWERLVK
jgi:hypothetical protein